MNVNIPAQFRGTYDFTLRRKDGTVQRETVHNIATSNIATTIGVSTLAIGSGSGTPAATDSLLFKPLWTVTAASVPQVQNIGDNGARIVLTYVVPATSAYTATITEVGMGSTSAIYTHATLLDAEGNAISIVKTENDELTIVVTLELYTATELPITAKLESFVGISAVPTLAAILLARLVSASRYYQLVNGRSSNNNPQPYNAISVRPRNMLLPFRGNTASTDVGVTPTLLSIAFDKSNMRQTITGNLRCRNDSFNTHYYRYLQFAWGDSLGTGGLGGNLTYYLTDTAVIMDLKNPDVFPPQRIAGIAVATGDGVTTDFACPINYFQKDTDVLYKNGVALTRGVDYEIDNAANKDCLPELMHIIYPDDVDVRITSDQSLLSLGNYLQFMAEPNVSKNSNITYDAGKVCTSFNNVYPLHFDWGAARKCNCLRGRLYTYYVGTMHVEYSMDNSVWESVATLDINESSGINTDINLTWVPVEARYWRIRVTRYGTSSSSVTTAYFTTGGSAAYLGYSNPLGIRLATPPAENDVLTMDCYVDIPLKTSDFAFNLALDLAINYK